MRHEGAAAIATYVNPVRHVDIYAWKRIDEGVDFDASGGFLVAIGHGQMVEPQGTNQGWPGGYCTYVLTEPGPLQGMHVYYAEGITAPQSPGRVLTPGEGVCQMIPYWHSGNEIGWASGDGSASWASIYGGGYDNENSTQAGISFNRLLNRLGAHSKAYVTGRPHGSAPRLNYNGITAGAGGGYKPPASVNPKTPVGDYDSASEIKEACFPFGWHGSRAYNNADAMLKLVQDTRYCDIGGRH